MDDYPWPDDCHTDEDNTPAVYTYTMLPDRAELIEQLMHANATAKRLAHTAYYARAHAFINDILYDLEEIRGR